MNIQNHLLFTLNFMSQKLEQSLLSFVIQRCLAGLVSCANKARTRTPLELLGWPQRQHNKTFEIIINKRIKSPGKRKKQHAVVLSSKIIFGREAAKPPKPEYKECPEMVCDHQPSAPSGVRWEALNESWWVTIHSPQRRQVAPGSLPFLVA